MVACRTSIVRSSALLASCQPVCTTVINLRVSHHHQGAALSDQCCNLFWWHDACLSSWNAVRMWQSVHFLHERPWAWQA